MAIRIETSEDNEAFLCAVKIKYTDEPSNEYSRRALVAMRYDNVKVEGGRAPVSRAPIKNVSSVASKLYNEAREYVRTLCPLSEAEKKVISGMRNSSRGNLDERVCIMLDGCSDEEIRPVIKEAANMLYPGNDSFPPKKY